MIRATYVAVIAIAAIGCTLSEDIHHATLPLDQIVVPAENFVQDDSTQKIVTIPPTTPDFIQEDVTTGPRAHELGSQKLLQLREQGKDDKSCQSMAQDSIKFIEETTRIYQKMIDDAPDGSHCDKQAADDIADEQAALKVAEQAKKDALKAVDDAMNADVDFPSPSFDSLKDGQCSHLFNSPAYQGAKKRVDDAKAAVNAAMKVVDAAKDALEGAKKEAKRVQEGCICDAARQMADILAGARGKLMGDIKSEWDEANGILCVLKGAKAQDCKIPEMPMLVSKDMAHVNGLKYCTMAPTRAPTRVPTMKGCPSGFEYSSVDLQGVGAKNEGTLTKAACAKKCEARGNCLGFEFNNDRLCWSHTSKSKAIDKQHPGWYTCVKKTKAPTKTPTRKPTKTPTNKPTRKPTKTPTNKPTKQPTKTPTKQPTVAGCPAGFDVNNGDLKGSKSKKEGVMTKAQCAAKCEARKDGCIGFEYSKNRLCYSHGLKDYLSGNQAAGWLTCVKVTAAPTRKPTKTPTRKPTKKPTKTPTNKPTKKPTKPAEEGRDYNNYEYAMLDGTKANNNAVACQNNWLPLPAGWELAPFSEDVAKNVIAAHNWGTSVVVFSNGQGWGTKSYGGNIFGGSWFSQSGNQYKPAGCNMRMLIRRGKASVSYGGNAYAMLDGTAPGDTSNGCQGVGNSGTYVSIPNGWTLATFSEDVARNVVGTHKWGTSVVVFGNGAGWGTSQYSPGRFYGGNAWISVSGNQAKPNGCSLRILIQRSQQGFAYGGHRYMMLDGTDKNSGAVSCQSNWLPMPAGWAPAPYSQDVALNVIAQYNWGTSVVVFSNGQGWGTKSYGGNIFGGSWFSQSGNQYKPAGCNMRLLIRS
jgi:hypothetical protein